MGGSTEAEGVGHARSDVEVGGTPGADIDVGDFINGIFDGDGGVNLAGLDGLGGLND